MIPPQTQTNAKGLPRHYGEGPFCALCSRRRSGTARARGPGAEKAPARRPFRAPMRGLIKLRQQESNLRWRSQSPLPYRLAMAHRVHGAPSGAPCSSIPYFEPLCKMCAGRGVSNRTVKENQKERSVYAPLDEMLDILISQGQNDYKPEQKQLLRLEDSLIFSENICSAVPMSEYNGASRH